MHSFLCAASEDEKVFVCYILRVIIIISQLVSKSMKLTVCCAREITKNNAK